MEMRRVGHFNIRREFPLSNLPSKIFSAQFSVFCYRKQSSAAVSSVIMEEAKRKYLMLIDMDKKDC